MKNFDELAEKIIGSLTVTCECCEREVKETVYDKETEQWVCEECKG